VDALRMRFLAGKTVPLGKIEGLEGAVGVVLDDVGVAFKKQRESAPCGADIHCLPEPV
jgi:hypothetical protein